ncbi:MAG: CerR family C-terminal domain-containing protein [Sedimentisphaerales bacterium]|nr:CerR family C-terminal domain-containing protein [Sedimentisphaerales bacterium]
MKPNNNKIDISTDKGVQERLLDAAEELFCERGFKGTSIRDIAASAGCNIASVNYYFGGKNNLYIEVWRRHLIPMRDARIASIERVMSKNGRIELEDLLKSFADTFVGSMVDPDKASRLSKLMAREYIDRHLPASIFVDEVMTPTMDAMRAAIIKTCPDLDESKVLMVIFSLIGQLVHLVHVSAIFEQGEENLDLPVLDTSEAIEHIVKFSIAGIRAYSKG